jgi:hypothetical protein
LDRTLCIRVPNHIKKVPDVDTVNSSFRGGGHTELVSYKTLSKEEYMERYGFLGKDGYYYYR